MEGALSTGSRLGSVKVDGCSRYTPLETSQVLGMVGGQFRRFIGTDKSTHRAPFPDLGVSNPAMDQQNLGERIEPEDDAVNSCQHRGLVLILVHHGQLVWAPVGGSAGQNKSIIIFNNPHDVAI